MGPSSVCVKGLQPLPPVHQLVSLSLGLAGSLLMRVFPESVTTLYFTAVLLKTIIFTFYGHITHCHQPGGFRGHPSPATVLESAQRVRGSLALGCGHGCCSQLGRRTRPSDPPLCHKAKPCAWVRPPETRPVLGLLIWDHSYSFQSPFATVAR